LRELRANLAPDDASYVALAEMLGIALLTVDRRFARAPMIRCSVELAGI
jgi:predicted nucleic acid-binding protein